MSFEDFAKGKLTKCSLCRFYNERPDVKDDIEGMLSTRLSDKPPTQYAKLIADYIFEKFQADITQPIVRNHYRSKHGRENGGL